MTIPRSTMVTFRQLRCELVLSFVTAYRQEVAEALELLLHDGADTGGTEVLPPGRLAAVLGRLLRRMKRALGDPIEVEKQYLNELGYDAVPRKRREAIEEMREELGRVLGSRIAKDRPMEAFDETYLLTVRMLVWAFSLAGRRELAAKLPVSLRRPSKKRAEAGEPQDP